MVTLSHIKCIGLLTNFTIGPLGLKVGGEEARKSKVRDASVIFTVTGSCKVTSQSFVWSKNTTSLNY